MQLSVDKNILLTHIQKISKVSPTRSTMPILNSILFEVNDSCLSLRSSDIEITMNTTLDINEYENGSVAIPTRII
ncbi:DNA polymerase III subunit beta, partial [bacterium]|nr:DNA polymerase III subunit beta [bacterium]